MDDHAFNFDMNRMQKCINSKTIAMPDDIDTEEKFSMWLDSLNLDDE